MRRHAPTLNLDGKRFVVLERAEYDRLLALERRGNDADLPPWPPADKQGNRPALEYLQVSIARDVIRERKAVGLTQEKLARLAGVRQETISRLESGKHAPTVRTVDKIDRALKQAAKRDRSSHGTKRKGGQRSK